MNGGTCAFCGFGDGYLGEMGDEVSERLHSAVRTGEPGRWKYEPHPQEDGMLVTWCGQCVAGLEHKFQRYDDGNLRAAMLTGKFRLQLDGIRWGFWELEGDEREKAIAAGLVPDDTAIHMDKLRLEADVRQMEAETFRRYGHDLTASRPEWPR